MSNLTEITQRLDALYQGDKKSKKMNDGNKNQAAKFLIDMTFMEESTPADVAVQLAKFPALTTKVYFETLVEKASVELIDEVLKEFLATDKDGKLSQYYPLKFSYAVIAIVKNAPEKAQQLKLLPKFVEFVARFAVKTDKSEKRYFKDMVNDASGKIYLLDYSTLKKGGLLNIWNATKSIYPNLKESRYEKFILEWAEKYALIPKSTEGKTPENPPQVSHDEKPVVKVEKIQEKKLETPCDKKPVDEVAKTPAVSAELALRIMPKIYPNIAFEDLDSKRKDKLMAEVERMKIDFSEYDDYTITLGEGTRPLDIDYDAFSDMITPMLTKNVLNAILKIMQNANVSPENIDAVILAGGSSGLRPFHDIVCSLFGEEKLIFDDRYQWMVAKGAAITSAIDCDFRLSDDICVLLSDGEVYPILQKDVNKVGDKSGTFSFSLTTDAQDAHFIFTDSTGENRYATVFVKAKGFLNEKFDMTIKIGTDQIATVTIKNDAIKSGYQEMQKINKLRFYYDLNGIEG